MVARFFRFDPVLMLEGDYFRWAARVAAYDYAANKEREAQEASKRKPTS